jgi:cytochrome c oxidase cbb3-type subunit III
MSFPFAERGGAALWLALACAALAGCERERRSFHDSPRADSALASVTMSDVHPGNMHVIVDSAGLYSENAYAVNDGKRLYSAYNCVGCHAHGGGGMGPPLMDDQWIYGADPSSIYATITEGRPNGMPSFRGKIPPAQIWELVAYVRSMSGQLNKAVRPSRADNMESRPAESQTQTQRPKASSLPPAAERP